MIDNERFHAAVMRLRDITDDDLKTIAYYIASRYPTVFCEALSIPVKSFETRLKDVFRSEGKVEAVKLYRNEKGGTLKEAVEAIHTLIPGSQRVSSRP